MKKIFIIGVVGFLGFYLCDCFIKEGFYVIGMDNFLIGSFDNIKYLFLFKEFEYYYYDVLKFVYVLGDFDYILYFVLFVSLIDYLKMLI